MAHRNNLAYCAFYLIHCKILFAFSPVHENRSHISVFAYAVNLSCIALLISESCSKSVKIYFLLPLLQTLLNNYTFSHTSKTSQFWSQCLNRSLFSMVLPITVIIGKAERRFRCFPGTSTNTLV